MSNKSVEEVEQEHYFLRDDESCVDNNKNSNGGRQCVEETTLGMGEVKCSSKVIPPLCRAACSEKEGGDMEANPLYSSSSSVSCRREKKNEGSGVSYPNNSGDGGGEGGNRGVLGVRGSGEEDNISPRSSPSSSPISPAALAHLLRTSLQQYFRCSALSQARMPSSSSSTPSSSSTSTPSSSSSSASFSISFDLYHHWWWTWACVSPQVRILLETNEPHGGVLRLFLSSSFTGGDGLSPSPFSSCLSSSSCPKHEAVPYGIRVQISRRCSPKEMVKEEEEEEEEERERVGRKLEDKREIGGSVHHDDHNCTSSSSSGGGGGKEGGRVVDGEEDTKEGDVSPSSSSSSPSSPSTSPSPPHATTNKWDGLRWRWSRQRWWTGMALPKEGWRRREKVLMEKCPFVWLTSEGREKPPSPPNAFSIPLPSSCSSFQVVEKAELQVDVTLLPSRYDGRHRLPHPSVLSPPPFSFLPLSPPPPTSTHAVANGISCALQRCSWWVNRSLTPPASSFSFSSMPPPLYHLTLSLQGHRLQRRAVDGCTTRERRRKGRAVAEERKQAKRDRAKREKQDGDKDDDEPMTEKKKENNKRRTIASSFVLPPQRVPPGGGAGTTTTTATEATMMVTGEGPPSNAFTPTDGQERKSTSPSPPPRLRMKKNAGANHQNNDNSQSNNPYYILSSRLPIFSLEILEKLTSIAIARNTPINSAPPPTRTSSSSCITPKDKVRDVKYYDSHHPHQGEQKKEVVEEVSTSREKKQPQNQNHNSNFSSNEWGDKANRASSAVFPFYRVHTLMLSDWSFSAEAWRFLPLLFYSPPPHLSSFSSSCEPATCRARSGERNDPSNQQASFVPGRGRRRRAGARLEVEWGGGLRRLYANRCGVHGMSAELVKLFSPTFSFSALPPYSSSSSSSSFSPLSCPSLFSFFEFYFSPSTISSLSSPSFCSPSPFPPPVRATVHQADETTVEQTGEGGECRDGPGGGGEKEEMIPSVTPPPTSSDFSDRTRRFAPYPLFCLSLLSSSSMGGLWFPTLQEVCFTHCNTEAFWMGVQSFLSPPPPLSAGGEAAAAGPPSLFLPLPRPAPLRVLCIQEGCILSPKRFFLLFSAIASRNRPSPNLPHHPPPPPPLTMEREEMVRVEGGDEECGCSFCCSSSSLFEIQVCHQKCLGVVLLENLCKFPFLSHRLRALQIPGSGVRTPELLVRWISTCYPSRDIAPSSPLLPPSTREVKTDGKHAETKVEEGEGEGHHQHRHCHHHHGDDDGRHSPPGRDHYFHYFNLRWNPGANDVFYEACEKVKIHVGDLWLGGSAGSRGAAQRIAQHVTL